MLLTLLNQYTTFIADIVIILSGIVIQITYEANIPQLKHLKALHNSEPTLIFLNQILSV